MTLWHTFFEVLRIGGIIIQANSPIFGLSLWRCYNLLIFAQIYHHPTWHVLYAAANPRSGHFMLTSWVYVALRNRHMKTKFGTWTSWESKTLAVHFNFIYCKHSLSIQSPTSSIVAGFTKIIQWLASDFEDGSGTFSPCSQKSTSSLASSLPWYECFFCEKWVTKDPCRSMLSMFPMPSFHEWTVNQWTGGFPQLSRISPNSRHGYETFRVDKWADFHLYNGYKPHNWSSILYKLVFLQIHHFIGNFMIPKGPYVCLPTTSLFTSSWRLFAPTPFFRPSPRGARSPVIGFRFVQICSENDKDI